MNLHIRPLRRRTRFERVLEAARDARLPSGMALPAVHPPKGVKSGVTAVVATTAASAGISALRRRMEETDGHR